MSDLIWREDVERIATESDNYEDEQLPKFVKKIMHQQATYIRASLNEIPAVDAVEVVRCKDCKWYAPNCGQSAMERMSTLCYNHERYPAPEWFCADGERKDGAE